MAEQPGRGYWADPPGTPGKHGPEPSEPVGLNGRGPEPVGMNGRAPAGSNGRAAGHSKPPRTSDLGRFDWFADSEQFGLSGSVPPPAGAPVRKRRLRPGRRTLAFCGMALACTALGGNLPGFLAVP